MSAVEEWRKRLPPPDPALSSWLQNDAGAVGRWCDYQGAKAAISELEAENKWLTKYADDGDEVLRNLAQQCGAAETELATREAELQKRANAIALLIAVVGQTEAELAALKAQLEATEVCLVKRTDERYEDALRADWLTRYFCAFSEVAIVALQAELTALKARRCSDCEHVPDGTCDRWRKEKDLNWHCSDWEAKP